MKLFFILLVFSLIFPKKIFAVTLTISDAPSQISNDPFEFNVLIEGARPATNYLEIAIFKEGTTDYFGQTWNGSGWYSGSDAKSYFPITIASSASTSARLKGRVEDAISGNYRLKVRRYTQSGNLASNDKITLVDLIINIKTPPPSESPTPLATSFETPPQSPIIETDRQTPIPEVLSELETPPAENILAVSSRSQKPEEMQVQEENKNNQIGIISLLGGIILIVSGGTYALFIKKRTGNSTDSQKSELES
ncbi:hypothetical protein HYS03_01435 [Candidatus Woesebacteria bacterium]|nr:hypothetical protein [Candidatus Woesebacteria bacterium]QQG47929.1 MAG: hypothetical protein HY044_02480 [Candidatus Woesebacteria bacterium]